VAIRVSGVRGSPTTLFLRCTTENQGKQKGQAYFDLRKLAGTKVSASAKAFDIILLESAKTILREGMNIPLHLGLSA